MNYETVKKEAVLLDPRNQMASSSIPVEVRTDPLTGRTSRICHFRALTLTWARPDLEKLATATRETCPFCPGQVMEATPCFSRELIPEGRMVSGEMVLFPNLAPYDSVGAVEVMGSRHFVSMGEFEPDHMAAAFRFACVFFRRIEELNHPEAVYHLVNWNYMPPAGSTIIHPHLQVFSTSSAPNLMRQELEAAKEFHKETGRNYWDDLVESESKTDRYLGTSGRMHWFSAYAPMGAVGDVLGVAEGVSSTLALSEKDFSDLSNGICAAMKAYDKLGLYSFNMNFFTGAEGDHHTRFHVLFSPRTQYSPALGTPDVGALRSLYNETVCMAYPEEIARSLKPEFDKIG